MAKGKIRTVLGDIDATKLGFTMAHEHILTKPYGGGEKDNKDHILDDFSKALQMLNEYKEIGGGAIIEATPESWGRNTPGLYLASKETGINVVACTGYMNQDSGMTEKEDELTIDEIAEKMYKDITVGMDGTSVKAGWVKCGASYNHITPNEEKVIRAGARVATKTGTCLHSHTSTGTMGIEILEILEEENFDLSRMILAHIDRCPDLWYHRKLLKKGANLIYDGPGKAKYYPDQIRVDLLKQLVKDGYENQIMLSNDMGRRSHHKVYGYGPGFNWIKERFLPRLLDEGFSQDVLDKFMVHNPANIYQMKK
ncbi:phosphotriesterase family protein [Mammaliicoccus lentus]|uniref:phosphotriesterase family protein n=1 Tax=Mammaliicoccus lentus TaxID=42858 RepID=UPI003CF37412